MHNPLPPTLSVFRVLFEKNAVCLMKLYKPTSSSEQYGLYWRVLADDPTELTGCMDNYSFTFDVAVHKQ